MPAPSHLHGGGAVFEEPGGVAAGENTAGRDHRDIQFRGLQVLVDLGDDGAQVVLCPVHAKAEMAAGKRSFHNDVIRRAIEFGVLAQEQRQGAR
ncbi:MAG: hypothetical protein H6R47_729 [Proteobacteria bacterium]|nr:hypothetical protein [Pseudomonadota bacterium]